MIQKGLYGLVLSGGKSSRMGSDKGLIRYYDKTQREHLHALLSCVCETVYTSCNAEQTIDAALQPLVDAYDLKGPMNGILTAFKVHPDKAWLIVAIDLPNLRLPSLQELIDHREPNRLATCFFDKMAGAPEPLLTLWEPASLPLLTEHVAQGRTSPRYFLRTNNVKIINPTDETIFVNINDAEGYRKWVNKD